MNPFSSNDFVLKRNYSYKNPWYRAVVGEMEKFT